MATPEIKCPKCGSTQLTASKKGYSGCSGCLGAILTGGIGLLAGTIGSNKVNIICLACGHQFRPGGDLESSIKIKEKNKKINKKLFKFGCLPILIFIIFIVICVNLCDNDKKSSTIPVTEKKDRMTVVKDSIDNIKRQDSIDNIKKCIDKVEAIAKKKWGKIQKKHPDWSDEDCEKIANKRIWIGMSLAMLKYERGNPNSATPSNYGDGTQWQWCWDDYTPSCFYGGEDLIITSYN